MVLQELILDIVGKDNFTQDEIMSNHCSFKTGGVAQFFVTPEDEEQLLKIIKLAKDNSVPFFVLGNGSNILVSDDGIEGIVINLSKHFCNIKVNETEIISGSGNLLSKVALFALENSLKGFEFASGIPGSLGGAIFMNAGAYGGEIKQVLKEVRVLTPEFEIITLLADELNLDYRTSSVEEKGYIILEGTIKLEKGSAEEIKELMNDFNGRRRDKQPLNFPSAGSTFKRPQGHFAGKLIEDSGLKGFQIGGAQVSEKHAGFVINKDNATTQDILDVIEHCKKVVFDKFGVELHCEVKKIGRF